MPLRFNHKRTRRALALLTALCCAWMSSLGMLAHTDHFLSGMDGQKSAVVKSSASTATHAHAAEVVHPERAGGPDRCMACEWQANSVSVALAVYAIPRADVSVPRPVTTFPRYLRVLAFESPSRAPPAV